MNYPRETVLAADWMVASGLSDRDVERRLGVPRKTVRYWTEHQLAEKARLEPDYSIFPNRWTSQGIPSAAYAHLLGLYLGDGSLAEVGRDRKTKTLSFFCDSRQTRCIEDCVASLQGVGPQGRVRVRRKREEQCTIVSASWRAWPELFPQHGPGRKHERRIALERWQWEIVNAEPWRFIKGLLHSDGCRSINRVRTTLPSGRRAVYEYPRWYFVNASEDILRIFRLACALVDVRCTRSRKRMITVSSRASVARLDAMVGAKA